MKMFIYTCRVSKDCKGLFIHVKCQSTKNVYLWILIYVPFYCFEDF